MRLSALCALAGGALLMAWPGPASAAVEPGPALEVLDLAEAAAWLRVSPELLGQLADARQLPARRVGHEWRFSRQALLEWLKGGPLAITARGPAPAASDASARVAQATPEAAPPAAVSAPPAAVGERPTVTTAEEIALRDQRVLLKRGALTVELGASYSRSERSLFPVIRQEQRSTGLNAAVRYGLLNDVQATLRVPAVARRTLSFSDASIGGSPLPRVERDEYLGDVSLSLLGVAWREAVGRPNLIWSLDAVLPSGPGDRGLGGGVVLSKSYDPAVLFAGLSYLHGFAIDAADPRRSLATHNLGLSFGYTYAVNDALALNTVFAGSYRNSRSPDGLAIPPARERYQLQLGLTWLLARGLFVEPAVSLRLGSESPDMTLSLNLNRTF